MLQQTVQTDKGYIGIIGLNEEDMRRLKARIPLDIDVEEITPPEGKLSQLTINYAPTYQQGVSQLAGGGIAVSDQVHEEASNLDEQTRAERAAKAE